MGNYGELDKYSLLAIDDDQEFLGTLQRRLKSRYELVGVTNASDAMRTLKDRSFDGILLDMDMPEINGLQLLKILRGLKSHIPVLMLTGNRQPSSIVTAIKDGAFDYVLKDFTDADNDLELRIGRMISHSNLETKAKRLEKLEEQIAEDAARRYEIVGSSESVLKLRGLIQTLKGHQTPVLILGESGTGKELIARALNSQEVGRKERPFIAVNCGAIPDNLVESELFGHDKGAFTGANARKDGKFLAANGGDIFLDEIADLSLSAQAKILRVLQEKEVVRVGSNNVVQVNVRVIAATHKDLKKAVVEGNFREDLYYRLAVMSIQSPPLRARTEDIDALAEHFLRDFNSSLTFSSAALQKLREHNWPGNIRALRNCIERSLILAQVDSWYRIEDRHIQLDSLLNKQTDSERGIEVPEDLLPQTIEDVTPELASAFTDWSENIFYGRAYDLVGRNKSKLAEKLSKSRDAIHRKLKDIGVGQGAEE